MAGWIKNPDEDYSAETRPARAHTQRARLRNQFSKADPKLMHIQPVASRNSCRPATEAIPEGKGKPGGHFLARRVDSRAQSAHIDKNQLPAPQQSKPKAAATLNASILNVKPLDSRRLDQLSPAGTSDTQQQLKSKYQNSDLNTLMLKGAQGKSTAMDKKTIRPPSAASIRS